MAEGSESREDNPYALDAIEEDGDADAVGGSSRACRWPAAASSDDDDEGDSDAGPRTSPPSDSQLVAGAGEPSRRAPEAQPGDLEAGDRPKEVLGGGLRVMRPLKRALPKRIWRFKGR